MSTSACFFLPFELAAVFFCSLFGILKEMGLEIQVLLHHLPVKWWSRVEVVTVSALQGWEQVRNLGILLLILMF